MGGAAVRDMRLQRLQHRVCTASHVVDANLLDVVVYLSSDLICSDEFYPDGSTEFVFVEVERSVSFVALLIAHDRGGEVQWPCCSVIATVFVVFVVVVVVSVRCLFTFC
jgi:hypothetical protein